MSVRFMIVAAAAALGAAMMVAGVSQAAQAPALDYEFFKTKVQPIFLKERPGHAPCAMCHTGANMFLRLEELAPGQTMWNDEQSRKQFESISKL